MKLNCMPWQFPIPRRTVVLLIMLACGSLAICGCYDQGGIYGAAMRGDVARVKTLLKHDPELVFNNDNDHGWTPLHCAAVKGYKDMAELLLANNANVNAKANGGSTPLHWAVIQGHDDVAALLLARKADVNAKANDGQTPLHIAALNGSKDMAELLLANKAHVNAEDNTGKTPLRLAVGDKDGQSLVEKDWFKGHKDVVDLLRQHGGHE